MTIDNIALGPLELATIYKAFDAAWDVVRHDYGAGNAIETDAARFRLANYLLAAYRRGVTKSEDLKTVALGMMAR
jgi:hypothetical protein